jgi:hypothetical protein
MNNLYIKSLKDILSIDVLLFVLKVGILAGISTSIFLWFFWSALSSFILSYLSFIPWDWLQDSGAKTISFALGYMLFIIMLSLFSSLLSETLLIKLAKKHYPIIPATGIVSLGTSLLLTLKASLVFLFLFMLLLPFLFIPLFGQVILLYLWSILLRKPTLYDVGALFISESARLNESTKNTRILAMIASLFNYIPFLNIFAPVFAQILFLHHILGKFDENETISP